jgi:hypothetical protein
MKKAKSRQEIAIEYGINRKTLQRWLDKENIQLPHRLLLPQEQEIIYNQLSLMKWLVTRQRYKGNKTCFSPKILRGYCVGRAYVSK